MADLTDEEVKVLTDAIVALKAGEDVDIGRELPTLQESIEGLVRTQFQSLLRRHNLLEEELSRVTKERDEWKKMCVEGIAAKEEDFAKMSND